MEDRQLTLKEKEQIKSMTEYMYKILFKATKCNTLYELAESFKDMNIKMKKVKIPEIIEQATELKRKL